MNFIAILIMIPLLITSPSLADVQMITCEEYAEIRSIIQDSDLLSEKEKRQLLENIDMYHGAPCI